MRKLGTTHFCGAQLIFNFVVTNRPRPERVFRRRGRRGSPLFRERLSPAAVGIEMQAHIFVQHVLLIIKNI